MNNKLPELYLEGRPVHTGYIRLENRKAFLPDIPMLNPSTEKYRRFWSLQFKRSIEGMWGKMFGQWRYCPGKLYYHGNYFLLETTDKNRVTRYVRPNIDDIEWEIFYLFTEAQGFSGFALDDERTAIHAVREGASQSFLAEHYPAAINSRGEVKTYVDPRKLLADLHNQPLGKALFHNDTSNVMIFGSRGGGKSFSVASYLEHAFILDGAVSYDQDFLLGVGQARQVLGSSVEDRSADLMKKIRDSIAMKADPIHGAQVGVWGKPGDIDFEPCPFYRDTTGSIQSGNKKNPFRHDYRKKNAGRWQDKGSKSVLYHVNYSINKGDGSQAAVGGRYLTSAVEEVGLVENAIDIQGANDAALFRDRRFGVEIYLGTSGNLGKVGGARKMFLDPRSYNIIPFRNRHGSEGQNGEVGFFLPFLMTLRQFKDENGNTDYPAAVAYVAAKRADKARSNDPKVVRDERMNRPCFVDEMWATGSEDILPRDEIEVRIRELLTGGHYRTLRTPVRLVWDKAAPRGVRYIKDDTLEPYESWPLDAEKRKTPSGCVVIYDLPRTLADGQIPEDYYLFGHDPYVEEDWDRGGSVGSTYIMTNPKYVTSGLPGNTIVASYIDKPVGGLDEYYENQEKLLALYGNPRQGLWYEKNRGQDCRAHYIRKNKTELLAPTPQVVDGAGSRQKAIVSYGYLVGNRESKIRLAKWMRDWLLEETEFISGNPYLLDGKYRNVARIPDLFLLQQMLAYDFDNNFDAVDGFRGCVIGQKETRTLAESQENYTQSRQGTLNAYLRNPRIFNHASSTKGLLFAARSRR